MLGFAIINMVLLFNKSNLYEKQGLKDPKTVEDYVKEIESERESLIEGKEDSAKPYKRNFFSLDLGNE
jgi:hypothetical protein